MQIAKDFEKWNREGDVEHIADIYSSDIVYMYQGMPNHEGKAVLTQIYRDFFSNYTAQVSVHVEEVRVFGDIAFDRATFTSVATPKLGGEATTVKGRVFEVLQKQGGKWKSLRVMVNTDEPRRR